MRRPPSGAKTNAMRPMFVCAFAVLVLLTGTAAAQSGGSGELDVYGLDLKNYAWFLVPPLVWNMLFTEQLGVDAYFSGQAPQSLLVAENLARGVVFSLPLLMPIDSGNRYLGAGLATYGVGLAAYFATWAFTIIAPDSALASHPAMRLAPAYLPILWLGGIALMAESWTYAGAATLFVGLHVGEYLFRLPR